MCENRIVETSKVWKGKSKIEKLKVANNFELKVFKKVKFFKAIKHGNMQ